MFSGVEYVREICNKRKIPISQLEKDCGFANGYLNPKKLQKIPYDRAKKIAEYLDLSLDYLLNGTAETEKAPTQEGEREIINPDIRMIARAGQKMTPEQAENLRKYAQFMYPEAFNDNK